MDRLATVLVLAGALAALSACGSADRPPPAAASQPPAIDPSSLKATVGGEPDDPAPGGDRSSMGSGPSATGGGGPSATVGGGPSATVGGGPSATVGGGPSATVGGGPSATVGGGPSATVGGGPSATVGGGPSATVGGGPSATVGGRPSATVGGGPSATVGGGPSATVGGEPSATVGGGPSATVGGDLDEQAPESGGGRSVIIDEGASAAPVGDEQSARAGGEREMAAVPPGGGAREATGGMAATTMSPADYIELASSGDLFEIESSERALDRTGHPAVRAFAQKLIATHSRSARELYEMQMKAGAEPLRPRLGRGHQALMARLSTARDAEFDHRFIEVQREALRNALTLHRGYSLTGTHGRLRAFAAERAAEMGQQIAELNRIGAQAENED